MTSGASKAGFEFVDPFGASADPARYVPRPDTERALERLVRAVRDESRSAVLGGIPGIGKTLLLRLLARSLAPELRTVHLPYASMPAAALCAWAMDLLGGSPSYDPVGAVVAHARRPHADGVGLVLLIDDAEAMPEEAAPQLARAARDSGGALRLVAAAAETAAGALAGMWDQAERVMLRKPMDLEETSRYLLAHLETAGLPEEVCAAFDASRVSELHRRSGGIPGRVNPEASLVLRRVLAREEEERSGAEEDDAAFERATGRLALAHSDIAYEDAAEEDAATFERAAGRLTLAQLEVEPLEVDRLEVDSLEVDPLDAEPPAEASAAAEALREAPTPGARRGKAWGGWLSVFGVFFVIGGGVGGWLGQRWLTEPQPQAPAPPPAAAVLAAPSPSVAESAGGVPSAAQEPAPASVSVQINANPWATILVDGTEVGVTPLAGVSVGAGSHRFEAHFPDGRIVERVVEIDEVNRFVVFP